MKAIFIIKKLFNIFRRNWLKSDVKFDKNIRSIIKFKFCRNMEKNPLILRGFLTILEYYLNIKIVQYTMILTKYGIEDKRLFLKLAKIIQNLSNSL